MKAHDILLTPGPTPLPPQVLEALSRPILHHRTPQYRALFKEVLSGMRAVMRTAHPVYCLTSSGTGAMQAAVVNLLSPGDEAIVILGGKFGERWQHLCRAYGITVATVPVAYGEAVRAEQVASALRAHPQAKAVFATLLETSTGVVHDLEAVGKLTRARETVLVVDAISGLAVEPCETDAWGIDVLVTGSQKGLMLPPGLAFLSVSDRAWALAERATSPRFYDDLRLYRTALANDDTPFTSGVSLVVALHEALKRILDAGLEATIQRCALMAQATRVAMEALGLVLFAKRPSNGVTAVVVPSGLDGKRLIKTMYERSRVVVAGGQGEMAGKIFRFAHMGAIAPKDVLAGVRALEDALQMLGAPSAHGQGVKAAQAVLEQRKAAAVRS